MTTVKQGQSFFDKVIEATGSIDNAFAMALLNNRSMTDDLAIGDGLQASPVTNRNVVAIWDEFHRPASALTLAQAADLIPLDGIGAMIIEDTFIVQ